MFQAQNRETINITWKVAVSFKTIITTSVFHNTTQHQTCKTKTKTKTDILGLRPVIVLRSTVSDHITGCCMSFYEALHVLFTLLSVRVMVLRFLRTNDEDDDNDDDHM